jgi:uncharacterized membrane protein
MSKGRLEAFSDGVIAIIITIMVLEMKVPHGDRLEDLAPLLPVFLMAAIAYYLLQQTIIRAQGEDSILKKAVGSDWKGRLSPVLYLVAIVSTLRSPWIAQAVLVAAALIWLIPDRRIENVLPRNDA